MRAIYDDTNGSAQCLQPGIIILLIPLFYLLSCNAEQKPSAQIDVAEMKKVRAYQAYTNNCVSCHNQFKPATGPALSGTLIDSRSAEWLYIFLTNRAETKNDQGLKKRQKEYAPVRCITLDTITTAQQEKIKLIIAYLKNYSNPHGTF